MRETESIAVDLAKEVVSGTRMARNFRAIVTVTINAEKRHETIAFFTPARHD